MRRAPGLALVLLLAACASDDDAGLVDTSVVETGAALAGSVRIEASGCGPRNRNGMATAIDDGLLVTAAHVVAGSDGVEVIDTVGRRSTAEVVMFDPLLDIAALRADDAAVPTVPIRPGRAEADDRGVVVVSGEDDALESVEVTIVRRAMIETTDIYRDTDVTRAGFEIEAAIDPGDSGAAVHLPGGIVGVVWARSTVHPERAWAVDLPDRYRAEAAAAHSPVDTGPCP